MRKNILFLVAVCVARCSNVDETNGDTFRFVFDPPVGKEYPMIYEMEAENTLTGDKTHFVMDVQFKVASRQNEKIILMTQYNAVSMTGNINGKQVYLQATDTAAHNSEAALVAAPVFAYLGKKFQTVYDNRFYPLEEKQIRSAGDSSVVAAGSKIQFAGRYPMKKIKKGGYWNEMGKIRIGANEIKNVQYKLKELNEDEAVVVLSGLIHHKGEKFGQEFSTEGKVTGSITVNMKTGWQKNTSLDISFILKMGDKKTPMKQNISFYMK